MIRRISTEGRAGGSTKESTEGQAADCSTAEVGMCAAKACVLQKGTEEGKRLGLQVDRDSTVISGLARTLRMLSDAEILFAY